MPERKARCGRFTVSNVYLSELVLKDTFPALQAMFEGMIITKAENVFHADKMEYVAFHPDFDMVDLCSELPLYRILLSQSKAEKTGVVTYTREIQKVGG